MSGLAEGVWSRKILRQEGVSAELCLPPQPLPATTAGSVENRAIHCSCCGRGGSRGCTAKRWGHKQLVAKEGLVTSLKMMVLLLTDLGRPRTSLVSAHSCGHGRWVTFSSLLLSSYGKGVDFSAKPSRSPWFHPQHHIN